MSVPDHEIDEPWPYYVGQLCTVHDDYLPCSACRDDANDPRKGE